MDIDLRAYPTSRHTISMAANWDEREEFCGLFSHRMSSLRKRLDHEWVRSTTQLCAS